MSLLRKELFCNRKYHISANGWAVMAPWPPPVPIPMAEGKSGKYLTFLEWFLSLGKIMAFLKQIVGGHELS